MAIEQIAPLSEEDHVVLMRELDKEIYILKERIKAGEKLRIEDAFRRVKKQLNKIKKRVIEGPNPVSIVD